MLDIKWIRENPAALDAALTRRGMPPQSAKILELDKQERQGKTSLQTLQQESNALAKQIGETKAKGGDITALLERSKELKAQIAAAKDAQPAEGGEESSDFNSPVAQLLAALPNILHDDVPNGAGEEDNQVRHTHGTPKQFSFTPRDHVALGESLGLMDFDQTAKISGSRFVTLKGQLARLERALASFMIDCHTQEFGYTEMSPPYLVKSDAVFGTAQLPKFADDLFQTTRGDWLVPTSEVSLTNLVRESVLSEEELPLRFCAYTPCFRSEAGSAGRDTRGMIRLHQFSKVELVHITTAAQGRDEHERLLAASENILTKLDLAYRVMTLCSRDTGFGSRKTYDLEVWLPAQQTYREISSVSHCGDFQARRMMARYKGKADKQTSFCHTLNGSGLAVGRTIVALLENYQNDDGSITIPSVLQPYMAGASRIVPAR